MKKIHDNQLYMLALHRPRGHGFGRDVPASAWMSENNLCWATLRKNVDNGALSVEFARKALDDTWAFVDEGSTFKDEDQAFSFIRHKLSTTTEKVQLLPGVRKRRKLHDVNKGCVASQFEVLLRPTHHKAAWLLNQLYLALPSPDENWVSDCQGDNFHTRLWEALLLAAFREQGILVEQPNPSPDFKLSRRGIESAWVEAVTANAVEKFDHPRREMFQRHLRYGRISHN